jgi:Icc-related predicted phosphoesterase
LFVTDLHGQTDRYDRLFAVMTLERPDALFIGGDLLPHCKVLGSADEFLPDYLLPRFRTARQALGVDYPQIFLILGNDDPRFHEESFRAGSARGLWHYAHAQKLAMGSSSVYGYACVPPTPFLLKDWERYDVSRYIPPGCVSPEEGFRTVEAEESQTKWGTIQRDLALLVDDSPVDNAIFLFHTPPYETSLDRAGLEGRVYEHVPIDVHVGSIAVRRFIEERQPLLTLHGHVHESARLSGEWKIRLGKTVCINGAHDGPELSLVRFDPASPWAATKELL